MKMLKWIVTLCCVMALAACGGGGGSNSGSDPFPTDDGSGTGTGTGTGGTTSGEPKIELALSSATVTTDAGVAVTATVTDSNGAPVGGLVVSFTSTGALGTISPATALTDDAGVATVQLTPAAPTTSGADELVASATVAGVATSATAGFTVVPVSGPVGTPSIALALSTTSVTTTTPATVTASVKDANGGAVVGQVVTFATPGLLGAFSPASALTDANGNAVVKLTPVAATTTGADQVVASATVNGTTLTASQGFQITITNADLILTLSSAQIPNTGSGSVAITVTAIDSNRNTVAAVPVAISADAGAVLTPAGTVTDSNGTLAASLAIGSNRANRLVTVTATAGSIKRSATVQVVGTTIASTLVPAVIPPSTAGEVQYRVVDQAGNAMAGQDVQIVASGLTPAQASGTTGANGDFTFSYRAPANTGSFAVTANIAGSTDSQTIQVQSAGTIPPVPSATFGSASASVSANPSVLATNLPDSTTNRSQIRALFLGPNNLPVPNVRARFDLNGDVNSVGGTFTTGTTTLYSDANGVVTTAYVPGTRSSPTNGVEVRLCYGASDTDDDLLKCLKSKVVTLTVTAEPLGVSIGTNEQIIVNTLTYVKQFIVTVSDSAGVAKPDVNLAVSLDLPTYRKGFYKLSGGAWTKAGALPDGTLGADLAICPNEDENRNGVLESGEDTNADGILWPRKPDVIVSLLQATTGADGTAILQIQYAKDHGSWVDALITVSASGVTGSEGRASYLVAPVPVDQDAIKNVDASPAFIVSPYGTASSCSNKN